MITAGPGLGKSMLARVLDDHTGLPVFHMDHIDWKRGWIARTAEENSIDLGCSCASHLAFEGGHSKTYAACSAQAETVI